MNRAFLTSVRWSLTNLVRVQDVAADLVAPGRGFVFAFDVGQLPLRTRRYHHMVQLAFEHAHCHVFVLRLTALVLTRHDRVRGDV